MLRRGRRASRSPTLSSGSQTRCTAGWLHVEIYRRTRSRRSTSVDTSWSWTSSTSTCKWTDDAQDARTETLSGVQARNSRPLRRQAAHWDQILRMNTTSTTNLKAQIESREQASFSHKSKGSCRIRAETPTKLSNSRNKAQFPASLLCLAQAHALANRFAIVDM